MLPIHLSELNSPIGVKVYAVRQHTLHYLFSEATSSKLLDPPLLYETSYEILKFIQDSNLRISYQSFEVFEIFVECEGQ